VRAPTGTQFALSFGSSSAVITEVAAGLRALVIDGVEVIQSYPESSIPPMGEGIVLVPWPNRIANATWLLDDTPQKLDITEIATGNATHGLLRNTAYRVAEQTPDAITLTASVYPQHGYPFILDTSVNYTLSETGLTVTHTIGNGSERPAPVAIGTHPYLKIGGVPTADLILAISATTVFETDEKKIPTKELPVEGTPLDLRAGRRISELHLDHGFGGAGFGGVGAHGEAAVGSAAAVGATAVGATAVGSAAVGSAADGAVHSLTAPDGQRVELWVDDNFGFVQAYTPTNFPLESGPGVAVAIEPMTAPANAFNSGQGLRWLEPGETWSASWGIRYTPAP
jgi:aldose 1-epimerase